MFLMHVHVARGMDFRNKLKTQITFLSFYQNLKENKNTSYCHVRGF